MAKYKIGDKIKIREDLEGYKYYGGIFCNSDMAERAGEIVTITGVRNTDDSNDGYIYNITDDECYDWSAEMFDDSYVILAEEDDDDFEFVEKIMTVQDFIDKFNTTTNTNVALYIRDKDYRITMGCGDIEDSILYSTFVNAYGRFKVTSISFEYDYDNKVSIALLEVEP
jgi:hypothetical protein